MACLQTKMTEGDVICMLAKVFDKQPVFKQKEININQKRNAVLIIWVRHTLKTGAACSHVNVSF